MAVAGIDGCPAGWFGVWLHDDGSWETGIHSTIGDIVGHCEVDLALIDIPIGLLEGNGRRACDAEARNVLKPVRHQSVFAAPSRQAAYEETHEAANEQNEAAVGRRLPIQAWNIVPKIREVDEFLLGTEPRPPVHECHPEVCFWGLSGAPLEPSKKTAAGRGARLNLLREVYDGTDAVYESAVEQHLRKHVARDDVIDALCTAMVASRGAAALATLPEDPETDPCGLPMEMVYWPRLTPST